MARGLHISYRSAFSQHLKNRVAGHQVNQEKDERDYQPDHRQRVQHAEREVSRHPSVVDS